MHVCVCVVIDKDKRQDGMCGRGFVRVIQVAQKQNQFHLSGEIHHIIFCSPFVCISALLV